MFVFLNFTLFPPTMPKQPLFIQECSVRENIPGYLYSRGKGSQIYSNRSPGGLRLFCWEAGMGEWDSHFVCLHCSHWSNNSYMVSIVESVLSNKGFLSNLNSFHYKNWREFFPDSLFQRTVISWVKTLNGFCCKINTWYMAFDERDGLRMVYCDNAITFGY